MFKIPTVKIRIQTLDRVVRINNLKFIHIQDMYLNMLHYPISIVHYVILRQQVIQRKITAKAFNI